MTKIGLKDFEKTPVVGNESKAYTSSVKHNNPTGAFLRIISPGS